MEIDLVIVTFAFALVSMLPAMIGYWLGRRGAGLGYTIAILLTLSVLAMFGFVSLMNAATAAGLP